VYAPKSAQHIMPNPVIPLSKYVLAKYGSFIDLTTLNVRSVK